MTRPKIDAETASLLRRFDLLARRELALTDARDDLIGYMQLQMPVNEHADDPDRTLYEVAKHHRVIAEAVQRFERGEIKKLILTIGPRMGKTELATKGATAWISGRNPEKSLIIGTYNEMYADDIGRAVRDRIRSPAHRQVFPEHELAEGSEASDRLQTTRKGLLAFVGRGGSITGRGGHYIIIDDPIKDDVEAQSSTIREKMWSWFTRVVLSRRMNDQAGVLIITTRWHEDDIVGRLTDPTNPHYSKKLAEGWKIIDMPALAVSDDDPLGRPVGESLWPERFSVNYLEEMREADSRGFSALYQCRPAPAEGVFFRKDFLLEYGRDETPDLKQCAVYVGSDHAVSTRQVNDRTAMVVVAVDPEDQVWVLPQSVWTRMPSDKQVDQMLSLIKELRPRTWWAERGQITKSIGPFLTRQMREKRIYCPIVEVTPTIDKLSRVQGFLALCSQFRVRFPRHASWWPDVRAELMTFPYGTHDDFVDGCSMIGLGLDGVLSGKRAAVRPRNYGEGSFGHMLAQSRRDRNSIVAYGRDGW